MSKKRAGVDGNIRDFRPDFIASDVWERMCEHWSSNQFAKRSTQGKTARKASKLNHTGGSQPFEQHTRMLTDPVTKEPPKFITVWEKTHKKNKGKGAWVTDFAGELASMYKEPSCDPTASQADRKNAEIEAWLTATGGPRKNRLVGMPRVPAYMLMPNSRFPARVPNGPSSSGGGPGLDESTFQRIINGVLERLQAGLSHQARTPLPTRKSIRRLAHEITYGSTEDDRLYDELYEIVSEQAHSVLTRLLADIMQKDMSLGTTTEDADPNDVILQDQQGANHRSAANMEDVYIPVYENGDFGLGQGGDNSDSGNDGDDASGSGKGGASGSGKGGNNDGTYDPWW